MAAGDAVSINLKSGDFSMPNSNCLEGIKCPKCGYEDTFHIVAQIQVLVTDDGTDGHDGNYEWDKQNSCACHECGHAGKVGDFRIEAHLAQGGAP
jgi:hypothetical protein